MAVARSSTQGTANNASNASTTVSFQVPFTVTGGFIWICSATFRGGSAATISGVPAGFNLIKRTDSGSAATNAVIVSYWYLATGSESGLFASITISGSSKYSTGVDAFSGCNTTTPVTGSVVSQVGTTVGTGSTSTLGALGAGQATYAYAGQQGSTANLIGAPQDTNNDQTSAGGTSTTGGSSATNVGDGSAFCLAATSAAAQSWFLNFTGGSTCAIHAFVLDVPAVLSSPRVKVVGQAANRSANY